MNRQFISRYLDLLYRVFLSLIIAIFFVYYGSDVNFLDALLIGSFYVSLAGNFIIAFMLISWVHLANKWINKNISWGKSSLLRILLVFFWGFILPGLIAYFFAALYFYVFGIDIRDTYYQNLIYPVILLLLLGLNACYSVYYYFSTPNTPILIPVSFQTHAPESMSDMGDNSLPDRMDTDTDMDKQKEYILANGNEEEIYLNVREEVCYFYCINNSYFLKTFNNETYDIDLSLKELEGIYSEKDFFRINRNTFLNFKAIHSFTIEKKGRSILVHLKPGLFTGIAEEEISHFSIPREKVNGFKRWIDR